MRFTILLLLVGGLTLTGCARIADSRLNPLNWFGRAENVSNVDASGDIRPLVPTTGITVTVDNRALVSSATSLRIEPTPDGAIVKATAQTAGSGFYNAELVPVASDKGTLTLAFRAMSPSQQQGGSQSITAAYVLSNAELSGVRRVQVQAQSNTLTSRR